MKLRRKKVFCKNVCLYFFTRWLFETCLSSLQADAFSSMVNISRMWVGLFLSRFTHFLLTAFALIHLFCLKKEVTGGVQLLSTHPFPLRLPPEQMISSLLSITAGSSSQLGALMCSLNTGMLPPPPQWGLHISLGIPAKRLRRGVDSFRLPEGPKSLCRGKIYTWVLIPGSCMKGDGGSLSLKPRVTLCRLSR